MAAITGGEKAQREINDLAKRLGVTDPATVRVGFLEDARYDDGTPVAQVAAINNFGAPGRGIPPRPFFSNMVKAQSPRWGSALAAALVQNNDDARKSLAAVGLLIAGQLQEAIYSDGYAPNSPVTNLLKDRFPTRDGMTFADVLDAFRDAAGGERAPAGRPLVWSGKMAESVRSEVS